MTWGVFNILNLEPQNQGGESGEAARVEDDGLKDEPCSKTFPKMEKLIRLFPIREVSLTGDKHIKLLHT